MSIRKTLKIVSICLAIVLAVFTMFIFYFFSTYQTYVAKSDIIQKISTKIFEKKILSEEFIYFQTERAKLQWFAKQNEIKEELQSDQLNLPNEEEERLLRVISNSIEVSQSIFGQIITTAEKANGLPQSLQTETQNRLASQLSVRNQEAITASVSLSDLYRNKVNSYFQKIVLFFIVSLIILVLFLIASFVTITICANRLFKQKTQLSLILNGIGDGVLVIDRSWNVLLFNRAACELVGCKEKEIIGKPLRNIMKMINASSRRESLGFIERSMSTGTINFMEENTVLVKNDGTEIPIGDSAAPYIDEKGDIIGAIIIFRDLTREKELAMLKSDFAYASHQLRTPVTKAMWTLEMTLEQKNIKEIVKNVRTSLLAVKSVQKLTSEMFEVSEIDQKMIIVKRKKVELTDIVAKAIETVSKENDLPQTTFSVLFGNGSTNFMTDPRLLTRAITEVLTNSVTYVKAKPNVKINITIENFSAVIQITDNGLGIINEEQPIIFTKFFRGSNFDTTKIIGAGLGLFIAKSYVELLQGKIWFKSTASKGTTFYIQIPNLKQE